MKIKSSSFLFPWLTLGLVFSLFSSLPAWAGDKTDRTWTSGPLTLDSGWQLSDAAKVAATGAEISREHFQPVKWLNATVPGTVLTSLVNDGIYPEPLYGENNRRIPDTLCRTTWWYRTTFIPPAAYAGKQVWLNFDGVNYIAEVWVNGNQVGTIKGAFTRGIFNVTSNLVTGQPNVLAVHIIPQPHPGSTHEKTQIRGEGPNGGVSAEDGPTFLCAIGWDWLPTIRDRDSGIWQDVRLSASGPVVVQNPYVTSKLPLPKIDTADLTVQATISNVTDSAQSGELRGRIGKISFTQAYSLAPHEARTLAFSPATTPVLHFKKPRLWWPNGYGPQNLYTLQLTVSAEAAVSDAQKVSFGIRQISYLEPGSDHLSLSVNGVRIIAKGGDWGMDEAMKRIPRQRLEAMIRLHQLAHYTIIRNWVGQSTSEEFYTLCDQYGILVWDEFFQPNPNDGPNPDDANLFLANVREKILRFRNHPSIALWCGRNEGEPPPAINDADRQLVNTLDPDRWYQPSSTSGHGAISWGPYSWQTPRAFYGFGPWEVFKTEIGCMSVPTLEAIHGMMPARDWNVVNNDWAEHDFCPGAHEANRFLDILAGRYGAFSSLPDFVRKSQLANYEDYRAMYEARFAKLFNPVTAIITWMSNPAQPSFVFQLYSYDLEPNASLFAVRKACEPRHVMLNQTNWHVMVVNAMAAPLSGAKVKVAVYNLDGSLQSSNTLPVTALPDAATDLGALAFPATVSPVHFIKLELYDDHNQLISDNFYWRARPAHEDDFTPLNHLPLVTLEARATRHLVQGQCRLKVTLRNPTSSVALLAHLQLRRAGSGQRVLPVYYSDNYVSLLPGESRTMTVEAALSDLNQEAPLLVVDGWNVTVKPVAAAGNEIAVEPNSDALVPMPATLGPQETSGDININCGGGRPGFYQFGAAAKGFLSDRDYQGGNTESSTNTIEVSAAHAAPESVYQTERWGQCSYTVPAPAGTRYTVRLHFAEVRYGPGQRKFDVDINGQPVLKEYDIAAEAGRNQAVVKEYTGVAPDANGQIVIALRRGSRDEPKLCGLEVIPEK
jgi:hypothetical protein